MSSSTLPPLDSGLRKAMLATYPFGFALSIAHTAVSHDPYPVLGLIPFTFSSIFAGIIIYIDTIRQAHECTNGVPAFDKMSQRKKNAWKAVVNLLDFALGGSIFAVLVLTWITMTEGSHYWYNYQESGWVMLGSYATVPFMGNMCIHWFFVLRTLYSFLPNLSFPSPVCPHCHKNLRTGERAAPARWLRESGPAGYSIVRGEETDSLYRDDREGPDTARPSMEAGQQETGVTTEDLTADAGADIAREVSEDEVRKVIDV